MKIVFLSPIGHLGGAERVLLDLMRSAIESLGAKCVLIVATAGPFVEAAERSGVTVELLEMPRAMTTIGDSATRANPLLRSIRLVGKLLAACGAVWEYRRSLRAAIDRHRPDFVYSNALKMHLFSRFAAQNRKLGWHLHDYFSTRPVAKYLLRWVGGPDVAVAISQSIAADFAKVRPKTRVVVNLNGIDLDEFSPGREDGAWMDRLAGWGPLPDGVLRVGIVAAFARWKGQDVFTRAVARMIQDHPAMRGRARFYVVGGPIYKTAGSQFSVEELKALAASEGVGDLVGFVPFQIEPARVHRSLDVMVHASTQPEPFGRTIVEAMAVGTPVIVSDAGGASEILEGGKTGLGAAPGDVAGLAEALEKMISNADLRKVLSENGLSACRSRFSRLASGARQVEIYKLLANIKD